MTTKTISSYINGGYVLAPQYDTLDVTHYGTIIGGVVINHAATMVNDGFVASSQGSSTNGLTATAALSLTNTGFLEGYSGVFTQNAAATVVNDGYIGGRARFGNGLFLTAGGVLTNGSAANADAYIEGQNTGVTMSGGASMDNFGGIQGNYGQGVHFVQGGFVVNEAGAYIASDQNVGVHIEGLAGHVFNAGLIEGQTGGVLLAAAGSVLNFASGRIVASDGRYAAGVSTGGGPATIDNYGEISSAAGDGVDLRAGGTVANTGTILGGAPQRYSYFGVFIAGAAGVVTNQAGAFIQDSVYLSAGGQVSNLGSIDGYAGTGVYVKSGSVTNGAAGDKTAEINGYYVGVRTGANTTVTNFGVIAGYGGFAPKAVELGASSTLIVEAGCAFVGQVLGDGGTLDLAGGTGTLTLTAGGTVGVSGSMNPATFANFSLVEIAAGATFVSSGAVTVSAGKTLVDSGVLILGGKKAAVTNDGLVEVAGGTVTVKAKVGGTGGVEIDGGKLYFTKVFDQAVSFTGHGTLELAKSAAFKATVSGFSAKGTDFLDLTDIAFTGSSEASFSGNHAGGTLTVSDGRHTARIKLSGNYTAAVFVAADDGRGGVLISATPATAALPPPPHAFVAAMAAFASRAGTFEPPEVWSPRRAATALSAPHVATA